VRVLNSVKPAILVRYPAISLDWRVLAFTLALTVATSIVFGILPAVTAAGIHIQDALKSAGLTQSAGRGATRLRKTLVAAELAVSLVLLIGAGLLMRSFLHLAQVGLGFSSDHLLTFRINPIGFSFAHDYGPFYSQVLDRVRNLSMVRAVTLADHIPLTDDDLQEHRNYPGRWASSSATAGSSENQRRDGWSRVLPHTRNLRQERPYFRCS
jgi:putative ABC transport system permease protein